MTIPASQHVDTGLIIERLGSDGDGLARTPDGRLQVVPFALPGEIIVNGVAQVDSAERIVPSCPHFTACGGCVAQHLAPSLYAAWKRDLVVLALRQHRIETQVGQLLSVPPRSRRRASFSLARVHGDMRLGFHKRRDAVVLALDECHVVTPRIEAALPALGAFVQGLPGTSAETRVAIADLSGGLDVLVDGVGTKFTSEQRTWIATKAIEMGLARLTLGNETMIERAETFLPGSAGTLRPSPGAFFQAVAEAETAIVDAVLAGLPKKPKRIADLFAGFGTLSLPLARLAPVFAADSDKAALAALEFAGRHAQGLKPIATRYRDLISEPLSPKELEPYDTVVLDPPRAGAKSQAESLARAKVQTVVMVSCNPQTFARDAGALIDGGFKLELVTPIDQFLWSAHVEVVAVFRR